MMIDSTRFPEINGFRNLLKNGQYYSCRKCLLDVADEYFVKKYRRLNIVVYRVDIVDQIVFVA